LSQRKRKPGRGGTAAAVPPTPSATGIPRTPSSAPVQPASSAPVQPAATQTVTETPPQAPPRPPALTRQQIKQVRAARARAQEEHWVERYSARAELKNAEARAKLVPLAPNEQPWALRISILLAMIFSLGTLALMVLGVKVDHKPPATSWIFYVIVMFACGVGMWRHWYQAVLAFMCLLGIALVILCALVVRFSNLLGLVIPLVLIVAGGILFWKLVGVLARLQMPERPTRSV
jgi:cation transport ATPase